MLLGACLVPLLSACGDGDVADLQAYMDEVRARPSGRVEAVPQFAPYEAFTYNAGALRSPFLPLQRFATQQKAQDGSLVRPDETRQKQPLEAFDTDTLQMVGLLANRQRTFALVASAAGVQRVAVGDYLGRSHGRVVAIHADRIELREIVPDGNDGWLERPRILPLKEGAPAAGDA